MKKMKKIKKKTRKAAAKRFRKTANGLIKFRRAGTGHLFTGKSRKRKRQLGKIGVLSDRMSRRIGLMLP